MGRARRREIAQRRERYEREQAQQYEDSRDGADASRDVGTAGDRPVRRPTWPPRLAV